jgi:hypothetical protein
MTLPVSAVPCKFSSDFIFHSSSSLEAIDTISILAVVLSATLKWGLETPFLAKGQVFY